MTMLFVQIGDSCQLDMSRYVRRARDQFNTVRDDVVKKQLQSVKGELRHASRSKPSTASAGSFKFSDMDSQDTHFEQPSSINSTADQQKSFLFDDNEDDEVDTTSRYSPPKSRSLFEDEDPLNNPAISTDDNRTTSQKKTLFDDPDSLFGDDLEEDFFTETRSKKRSNKQSTFDDLFDIPGDTNDSNGKDFSEVVDQTPKYVI